MRNHESQNLYTSFNHYLALAFGSMLLLEGVGIQAFNTSTNQQSFINV